MRLLLTLVLAALPLLILADDPDPPYTVHCGNDQETWCGNCNLTSGKVPWKRPANQKWCPQECFCITPPS
ncbi:hypothetical protein PGT21_002243 [Puccinia graminis f. sp. tritici]|uniref:Uncharacterized protein n=1 Tax=Puccinia graminis f. sp. tritici TaxID=56615 RepID=A0A5B0RCB3_PUCGR|nr:hypothetical protein PGT21_002243 [Puccinia graminis f. sp. tritici]KAA1123386.1 hypothetical protein PGTUg99_018399 [Puccinia graminis f. sp. tritici]